MKISTVSPMTTAEYLGLPEGYTATRFPSTWEIEKPGKPKAVIPVPYDPQTRDWWIEQAAEAIKHHES